MEELNQYLKSKISLRYWLLGRKYYEALKAMNYAEKFHKGNRKDGMPEFSHQIQLVNLARTFIDQLLYPEATLIVLFLHDIPEDYDVSFKEIEKDFGKKVADAVYLLSKEYRGEKKETGHYYERLQTCPIASLGKGLDRVHNISTMLGAFSEEKQKKYIEETEIYIIPALKNARRAFPEQEPCYENIKFILYNLIKLYRAMHKHKHTNE